MLQVYHNVGFDYKENGLNGYYSSTYHVVTYDNGILNIYIDEIVISIL